jgi:uncharacterized protein (DUF1697 family)
MQRYAAFLRGVSPMNCKMPALAKAFESAGFRDVRTLLSSGNVVFSAGRASEATIRRKAEAAMQADLPTAFTAFIRSIDELAALMERDPFSKHRIASDAKRIVTFLQEEPSHIDDIELPIEKDGARILAVHGREVISAYRPTPKGPVFMTLLDKTFGKQTTTRTWDTLAKVVKAGLDV